MYIYTYIHQDIIELLYICRGLNSFYISYIGDGHPTINRESVEREYKPIIFHHVPLSQRLVRWFCLAPWRLKVRNQRSEARHVWRPVGARHGKTKTLTCGDDGEE